MRTRSRAVTPHPKNESATPKCKPTPSDCETPFCHKHSSGGRFPDAGPVTVCRFTKKWSPVVWRTPFFAGWGVVGGGCDGFRVSPMLRRCVATRRGRWSAQCLRRSSCRFGRGLARNVVVDGKCSIREFEPSARDASDVSGRPRVARFGGGSRLSWSRFQRPPTGSSPSISSSKRVRCQR